MEFDVQRRRALDLLIEKGIPAAKAEPAPLRIARGIQNKVLEAMAMATPVGTSTRPPAAGTVVSMRARRSSPASPGWAYAGNGRSGSRRTIGMSTMAPQSLRSTP